MVDREITWWGGGGENYCKYVCNRTTYPMEIVCIILYCLSIEYTIAARVYVDIITGHCFVGTLSHSTHTPKATQQGNVLFIIYELKALYILAKDDSSSP